VLCRARAGVILPCSLHGFGAGWADGGGDVAYIARRVTSIWELAIRYLEMAEGVGANVGWVPVERRMRYE
jgi:hypothetical protein